jgi:hypothetical protein
VIADLNFRTKKVNMMRTLLIATLNKGLGTETNEREIGLNAMG